MSKRLKQIKKSDIPGFEKQVVDSLIETRHRPQKEEKLEQMRCKVDILDGYDKKAKLVDSFIVNTNSLDNTIYDIVQKYGSNVQFKITNLYDEKIVAKRMIYTGGYDKDKSDREHFNRQMETVHKIHKFREEGKSLDEVYGKVSNLAAKSVIKQIYESTDEQMKQKLRDSYENQTLGKSPNTEILSKSLNTNKDNIVVKES